MRSPKKGKAPRLTLADLKPQQQITCFWCQQPKPAQGSRPFHAHHVCADCVQALDTGTAGAGKARLSPQNSVGNQMNQNF